MFAAVVEAVLELGMPRLALMRSRFDVLRFDAAELFAPRRGMFKPIIWHRDCM